VQKNSRRKEIPVALRSLLHLARIVEQNTKIMVCYAMWNEWLPIDAQMDQSNQWKKHRFPAKRQQQTKAFIAK